MKRYKLTSSLPRDVFEYVRSQTNRGSLRVRMTLMVAAELFLSAGIALALVMLLDKYFNSTWLIAIAFAATSIIIGSAVTAVLSKLFFDPVKKLGCAMEQVADGDYSVRLNDSSSSKEVMEMYAGFNLMTHELQTTEMLQSDFVSNVSHEFKTPINAIEGYSMLLQGSDNLSEDQERYVDKIIFNTRRLSSLVGSILLLSKLENQQISTKQSVFRLDEQIRQSIVALEPAWAEKGTDFDIELERLDYEGSEVMMRHVWDNLIGNAIKFGPVGGLVRMTLAERDGRIEFSIEDQGPGLSEDAIKHIYDKFYQADSSHKEEGNGLGLALVKRILTLENGVIKAENLPQGGCRFTVLLGSKQTKLSA